MVVRVILIMTAVPPNEFVATGKIQDFHVWRPDTGSHLSFTPNRTRASSASTKDGIAHVIRANVVRLVSRVLYCFVADRIPSGSPVMTIMIILIKAILKVMGILCASSSVTGIFDIKDLPMLRCVTKFQI
jgi:hypothetical protein